MPISVVACPHCGQPSLFPNVRAAEGADEVAALNKRFDSARARAERRGAGAVIDQVVHRIETAEAVLNRPLGDLTRLVRADSEIYATFYQRTDAGLQIPGGDRWDKLRAVADTVLFGERNKREIRFAALSLDGVGLPHYGECSIALKTSMIAHRTSLIEENSVIFMQRHGVTATDEYRLPPGYRASWPRRGLIAAAKIADALQPTTIPAEFSRLLLAPGAKSANDRFIEVHIWGSLTVRSMRKVTVKKWQSKPRRAEIKALEEKLAKYNVAFEKPN